MSSATTAPSTSTSSSTTTLQRRLAAAAPNLLQNGWAVIDDALPSSTFQLLREQMASLHAAGGLRQHRFGFKASESAKPELYTKPNIFEAELDDAPVAPAAPKLKQTLQTIDLQSAARAAFPSLELLSGADAAAIKLQCNEGGGGSFPHHYDNAGPPSKRRLTCLFYLNPQWKDGDGGELLLSPWLQPPIRIAPSHGRLVLFLSDTVLHRVLPSRAAIRYCFTIWLDGASTNGPAALRLDARKPCDEALLLDPAQRLLSRAVYSEEYAESIRDCFATTPGQRDAVLAAHERHVASMMANQAFARLVTHARVLKQSVGKEEVIVPPPLLQELPMRMGIELRIRALCVDRVQCRTTVTVVTVT